MITSRRNPHIAFIRSLARSSVRRRDGFTVAEGPRVVAETLRHGAATLVLAVPDAAAAIVDLISMADSSGVETLACTPDVFAFAATTESPQGILAVLRIPSPEPIQATPLALVIDGVQDPGNVGGLVRTALAAGVTQVLATNGGADPYAPKAMRAGSGAQFRLPVATRQPAAAIARALGADPLYAATPDGEALYTDIDWTQPCALAVGSEAHGVSDQILAMAAATIRIPLAGQTASLNAAAAAAAILFEAVRRRSAATPK